MTLLIIIIVLIFIVDMTQSSLRQKLILQIMDTKHNKQISKMVLPKFLGSTKNRGLSLSPIKYVFTRKHKELNNKPLSNLSDLILVLYLVSWLLWVSFIIIMAMGTAYR